MEALSDGGQQRGKMKNYADVKYLKGIGNRWLVDISEGIAGVPKKADGHYHYKRRRIMFAAGKRRWSF